MSSSSEKESDEEFLDSETESKDHSESDVEEENEAPAAQMRESEIVINTESAEVIVDMERPSLKTAELDESESESEAGEIDESETEEIDDPTGEIEENRTREIEGPKTADTNASDLAEVELSVALFEGDDAVSLPKTPQPETPGKIAEDESADLSHVQLDISKTPPQTSPRPENAQSDLPTQRVQMPFFPELALPPSMSDLLSPRTLSSPNHRGSEISPEVPRPRLESLPSVETARHYQAPRYVQTVKLCTKPIIAAFVFGTVFLSAAAVCASLGTQCLFRNAGNCGPVFLYYLLAGLIAVCATLIIFCGGWTPLRLNMRRRGAARLRNQRALRTGGRGPESRRVGSVSAVSPGVSGGGGARGQSASGIDAEGPRSLWVGDGSGGGDETVGAGVQSVTDSKDPRTPESGGAGGNVGSPIALWNGGAGLLESLGDTL